MAASNPSSPLLALPFELRLKVLEELLCPDPHRANILYHDRRGREKYLHIDPTILRINKQIYDEGLPLLYDNNIFGVYLVTSGAWQCTGGSYPDGLEYPRGLFRKDSNVVHIEQSREQTGQSDSEAGGLIYPHCFRRMRHLKIVTSCPALFMSQRDWNGASWSHTGDLLLRILYLLHWESTSSYDSVSKRLDFNIRLDWQTHESHRDDYQETLTLLRLVGETETPNGWGRSLLMGARRERMHEKLIEIVALLRSIRRTRLVNVKENVLSCGHLSDQVVDLDNFSWIDAQNITFQGISRRIASKIRSILPATNPTNQSNLSI